MKSSSGSKGDRKDLLIVEDMTRREFLRAGVGLAAVASGLEMIGGYATAEAPPKVKAEPVVYPPLPYNKVQPPKEGCLVGLYKDDAVMNDPIFQTKMNEGTAKAKNIDEYAAMLKKEKDFMESMNNKYPIGDNITYYENSLGAKPFIFALLHRPRLYLGFPIARVMAVAQNGVVPYVHANPGHYFRPNPRFGIDEIARGQRDSYIKQFAQGAAEFGKEHGGFFFTTMAEANGGWNYWGKSPNFIAAWRRIWQIFEDEGANHYATWVWEAYCPEGSNYADDPELYYPGDKYVDWIGLNAFSIAQKPKTNYTLDVLMNKTYRRLLKNHPLKPIMQAEFGKANQYDQSTWLKNAYRSIKNDFPAIKAAICYDNITPEWYTGDHTLNPKSLQTLKEIFKDPYWIMAK